MFFNISYSFIVELLKAGCHFDEFADSNNLENENYSMPCKSMRNFPK